MFLFPRVVVALIHSLGTVGGHPLDGVDRTPSGSGERRLRILYRLGIGEDVQILLTPDELTSIGCPGGAVGDDLVGPVIVQISGDE